MLKSSVELNLPSYFSGIFGLNVRGDGQRTCHSSLVKEGHPTLKGRYLPSLMLVDVGAFIHVGLAVVVAALHDDCACSFPPPVLLGSPWFLPCSRIRGSHRYVVGLLVARL